MVSVLTLDQAVQGRALVVALPLFFRERHFTLTLPLSTQEYYGYQQPVRVK